LVAAHLDKFHGQNAPDNRKDERMVVAIECDCSRQPIAVECHRQGAGRIAAA